MPAAPPVSLDGINTTITGIEGDLIELHNNVRQVKGDIVLTNQDLQLVAQGHQGPARQDEKISELEAEVDDLRPTIERGGGFTAQSLTLKATRIPVSITPMSWSAMTIADNAWRVSAECWWRYSRCKPMQP